MVCFGLFVMWCSQMEPKPSPSVRCPPMAAYSIEYQRKAAAEVRSMPNGSAAARLIADYGTLRARCRAIEYKK